MNNGYGPENKVYPMFMDTSVGKWCDTFGVLTFSDKPMSPAKYPSKVAHLICAPIVPRFCTHRLGLPQKNRGPNIVSPKIIQSWRFWLGKLRCFGDVWCIPIFGKHPYDLSNGPSMVPRPDQAKAVDPKQARPWDLLSQWIQYVILMGYWVEVYGL